MPDTTTTQASRKLDELVAEKVMGLVPCDDWKPVNFGSAGGPMLSKECAHANDTCYPTKELASMAGTVGGVRPYSTKIAAAWEIVEKLRADQWDVLVGCDAVARDRGGVWECEVFTSEGVPPRQCAIARGTTAPEAISLAALSAVAGVRDA